MKWKNNKWEIGAKVIALHTHDNIVPGSTGIIIDCLDFADNKLFGIQFDNPILSGHDCEGKGKNGHCWYIYPEFRNNFELI